jgi:hypothetical protein
MDISGPFSLQLSAAGLSYRECQESPQIAVSPAGFRVE